MNPKAGIRPRRLLPALVAVLAGMMTAAAIADDNEKYEARFNADGELIRPAGWREWVFVGSPLTPNSMNGGEAPFPEFHSVYIDPKSWAHYSFGHKPEPYARSTAAMPDAACAGCHAAAAAEDMVFTQYYPILRVAKGAGDAAAGVGGEK